MKKNSNKKKTFHDLLTEEDINILLEDYEEINNIHELKPGILIRYYKLINQNNDIIKLFRTGGTIINIDFEKKYLIVSNGKTNWSVQMDNSIFYKKITLEELKNYYENEIDNKNLEIKKYKKYIENLKNKYNTLVAEFRLIKKNTSVAKS